MARSGLVSLFLICWIWQTAFCQDVTRRLTNQERAEKIADLLRKADFKGQDITIEVNRGVVTLTGYVEDTVNQKLVSEVASRVEGVTQVNNMLTVGEDVSRGTNQERAEKIADSLQDALLKGHDIRVEVNRGEVILTGIVADADNQKLASEVALRVEGVTQVNNMLTVGSVSGSSGSGVEVSPDSNSDSQRDTVDAQFSGGRRGLGESPFAESSLNSSLSIPISMGRSRRFGKKLLDRQKELFQSDSLHRIEVSVKYKNESTPLYDIYCGKHRLVIVTRSGGSNYISFEGTILNSFQGGLYEWKSGETTGKQYECGEQELLNLFQYNLDPGGFITSLYLSFETQPELFEAPIKRTDDIREHVLKKPLYQMHSIAVSDDPLWFHELNHLDKDGKIVSRVYGKPTKVDAIPESVTAALKEVKFEPTKQTVYSLMRYP